MLPLRSSGLWPNAQNDLAYLNAFVVERAIADVSVPWAEIVREFSDERSYLSVSLATRPHEDAPTVQIEFGVQDETKRHATGGFAARWLTERQVIEGLEAIVLDGKQCDVSPFVARLICFLRLPETVSDTVEQYFD